MMALGHHSLRLTSQKPLEERMMGPCKLETVIHGSPPDLFLCDLLLRMDPDDLGTMYTIVQSFRSVVFENQSILYADS